jgi:hypothetical protein
MTTENRFYDETFQAAVGSLASGAAHNTQYELIQAAFKLVQDELDALQGISGITSLSGFPASFAGAGLKMLRVNAAESAIEFVAPGLIGIKTVAGTTYTLVASDAGQMLVFTNAAGCAVTVPTNADVDFEQGAAVLLVQYGDAQVSVAGASGVTVNSTDGLVSTRTQFAQITIIQTSDDVWLVGGDRA